MRRIIELSLSGGGRTGNDATTDHHPYRFTDVRIYGDMLLDAKTRANRRTRNTKEGLFAAALDLFAAKAVEAASIRDIARRFGISAAAFYNHFRSRNELLQAVYDYYRSTLTEPAHDRGAGLEPLPEGLDATGVFTR